MSQDLRKIIRDRRLKLGLTQKQLAENLGVSKSWVTQVETTRQSIGINLLDKLAEALLLENRLLVEKDDNVTIANLIKKNADLERQIEILLKRT